MNFIRRWAWAVLALLTAVFALLGVGDVVGGATFEPTTAVTLTGRTLAELEAQSPDAFRVIDFGHRGGGITLIVLSLVLTAIAAGPYRTGERWAWLAMWALPGWLAAVLVHNVVAGTAPGQSLSGPALSAPVFGLVVIAQLMVDRPRFWAARHREARSDARPAGA